LVEEKLDGFHFRMDPRSWDSLKLKPTQVWLKRSFGAPATEGSPLIAWPLIDRNSKFIAPDTKPIDASGGDVADKMGVDDLHSVQIFYRLEYLDDISTSWDWQSWA